MIRKLVESVIYGAIFSIPLIVSGMLISRIIIGDPKTLDFTLFVIGGIPIVIFLPSLLSSSKSGALHTPKVIFRKVDTLDQRDRNNASSGKEKSKFFSPATLVFAGLITWLAGYLLMNFA